MAATEGTRPDPGRWAARLWNIHALPDWLSVLILAPIAIALGLLAVTNAELAVVVLVFGLFAALVAVRPGVVAVLAFGLVFVIRRLGPGGSISYTDALVAAASVLALPALAGTPQFRRLSTVNRAMAAYFLLLLPSIVLNHHVKSDLEWLHRLVLVGGALVVGAWLVRDRLVRPAIRLLLAVALFFSALAVLTSVRTGFAPAYPLGFQKNFVGSIAASTLLIVVAAPRAAGLPRTLQLPMLVVLGSGLLATQSRGAMLGAALGIALLVIRPGSGLKLGWRMATVVVAVGFGVFAYFSVNDQLTDVNYDTNSLGTRVRVETRTRQIWHTSELVGVGLRYYNIGNWGPLATASNNAFNNELAEAGLVGAAGFVVFHAGLFTALWRRRGPLANAALAATAGRFLHGQVDIYWSAGTSSLPMMLAGIALAATPAPHEPPGTGDPAADSAAEGGSGPAKPVEQDLCLGEDGLPP